MDTVTKEKRSYIMSRIRSKWTGPERRLYEELNRLGLDFETHADALPGKPDFVFASQRLVVFVEGCFWHGCPRHYKRPKSNKAFWDAKVSGNRKRDARNRRSLFTLGFGTVRVWECATRGIRLEKAGKMIAELTRA